MSGDALPSRRQSPSQGDKTALQTIMGQVDELSGGRDAAAGAGMRDADDDGDA